MILLLNSNVYVNVQVILIIYYKEECILKQLVATFFNFLLVERQNKSDAELQ
jgi:uncharacterized lipoprotein YehR (DUF1307 family)